MRRIYQLVFIALAFPAFTQSITGPSSVIQNTTHTYNLVSPLGEYIAPAWSLPSGGGTITNTWSTGNSYYASIQWTSIGTRKIRFKNGSNTIDNNWVTVADPFQPGSISASTTTTICSGSDPGSINSSASASGSTGPYSYQWQYSTNGGSSWSNTGSATSSPSSINPPVLTSPRKYRRRVISNSQTTYSNIITYTIKALPVSYSVTGGGSFCSGGSGVSIGLSDSESSLYVHYQLKRNGTNVGSPQSGGGNAINFGNQTTAGTYTVVATNTSTGCFRTMSGSKIVTINALPTTYSITGGGGYCIGDNGSAIGLSDSQSGVNYQLKRGPSNVGSAVSGTGNAISFGNHTTTGSYTVVATKASAGCTKTMSGNKLVSIDPLPADNFMTGGGSFCSGSAGVAIGLSNTQTGVNYQLKLGSSNTGSILSGTGSGISFGNQTVGGNYTVIAMNASTGCTAEMIGPIVVTANALPTLYTVTGGGSYCSGGSGVAIGLSDTQTGVNYQLKRNGINVGSLVSGTNVAIGFGNQTTAGTYTVRATNASTGCPVTMLGSKVVSVNVLPTSYILTGGGSYCSGEGGVDIGLSDTQSGVNYQLKKGGVNIGSLVSGTNGAISFGNQTATGTYTAVATNASTGCVRTMSGTKNVTVGTLPVLYSVVGGGSYCSGGSGVLIGLYDSENLGVEYQLKRDGLNVGELIFGTGNEINFGHHTAAGTYTVVATYGLTGCVRTMSGNAMVSVDALPVNYNVTGGGEYCDGGSEVAIGLSNTQSGVNYQLKLGGANVGSAVNGINGAISFGNHSSIGIYSVKATNPSTLCTRSMSGNAEITLGTFPGSGTISASGTTTKNPGDAIQVITGSDVVASDVPQYQWYRKFATEADFTPITNATNRDYTPPAATYSVSYKRWASSCGGSGDTSPVDITVTTNPGNIGINQNVCSGTPVVITSQAAPSGGNGTYNYRWKKYSGEYWEDLGLHGGLIDYNPSVDDIISVPTQYLREVTSQGVTVTSNIVTITPQALTTGGSLSYSGGELAVGTIPSAITGTDLGAVHGLTGVAYQWSKKGASQVGYINISGAVGVNYTPMDAINEPTSYRRLASLCGVSHTRFATFNIDYPPFIGGSVTASEPVVCFGNIDPGVIIGDTPTGGYPVYIYQWQEQNQTVPGWTDIPEATEKNYDPNNHHPLVTSFNYRRIASTYNESVTSSVVTINTVNFPGPGTATPSGTTTKNPGDPIESIIGSDVVAGTDLQYQWHKKFTTDADWSPVSGATNRDYTPPTATYDVSYRRWASSCNGSDYTDPVDITVTVDPGSIGSNKLTCVGDPVVIVSAVNASGGNGVYFYTWKRKGLGDESFETVGLLELEEDYNPTVPDLITGPTEYIREVMSGTVKVETTSVTITPQALASGGVLNHSNGELALGAIPSAITGNDLETVQGISGITYSWSKRGFSEPTPTTLSGESGISYTPTVAINEPTFYTRTASFCGVSKTATATVNIDYPPLVDGVITASEPVICFGDIDPGVIIGDTPTGGYPVYIYQWQDQSQLLATWTDIPGATGKDYDPSNHHPLVISFKYRRITTSYNESAASSAVTISALNFQGAGTIAPSGSTTKNSGSNIETIIGSDVVAGTDLQYQWYKKFNTDADWSIIAGATNRDYTPPAATYSVSYKRWASSCSGSDYTSPVDITVTTDPGNIGTDQVICPTTPVVISNQTTPSGGNGVYNYQWKRREVGVAFWTDLGLDAVLFNYDPFTDDMITVPMEYVREVTSEGSTAQSNIITITPETPTIPTAPTQAKTCGNTILTRAADPAGITWYWQGTNSLGESVADSSLTYTVTTAGTYYLKGKNENEACWGLGRSISVGVNSIPSMPDVPAMTNYCGSTELTSGMAPSGITWYWQGTNSNGSDISDFGSSYTATSPGTYYIRSKNDATDCWGPSRSVAVTISQVPAVPSIPTVNVGCGTSTVVRITPPAGFTWYWQNLPQEESMTTTDENYLVSDAGIYYLRARNDQTGCWSDAVSVPVSIDEIPAAMSMPEVINGCGESTVRKTSTPFSGVHWYWQTQADGEDQTDESQEYSMSASGTAFLRLYKDNGCWGPTVSVDVTVTQVPGTPNIVSQVPGLPGQVILTRGTPPGEEVTWFWQGLDKTGMARIRAGTTFDVLSNGMYYLRAQNDLTKCWSMELDSMLVTSMVPLPTEVTTIALSGTEVSISWGGTFVSGTDFLIRRTTTLDGTYALIHTASENDRTYTDTSLTAGTRYYYTIQARKGGVESAPVYAPSTATLGSFAVDTQTVYADQKGGNIAAIQWNDGTGEKMYTYGYDAMSRLKFAHYIERSSGGDWTQKAGGFQLKNIMYDLNGNIQSLSRQSYGSQVEVSDELSYHYEGGASNQLAYVEDATADSIGFDDENSDPNDYQYDANGNMVKDLNKGIDSIYYNYLNLPSIVDFKTPGDSIVYLYDAAGIKLQQKVWRDDTLRKTTDYVGAHIYENGELQLIQHEEGRLVVGKEFEGLAFSKYGSDVAGLSPYLDVTITSDEDRVKTVANQTISGIPGIYPIESFVDVDAGETYTFKVKGYSDPGVDVYFFISSNAGGGQSLTTKLPEGAANEDWISTTFTAASGAAQVGFGILFNNPTAGDAFYIDEAHLYQSEEIVYDYQYHLKDHLGNTRLTFSTTPENFTATAYFEDGTLETDTTFFGNVDTPNRVAHPLISNTGKAARLNNLTPAGPYAVLRVNKGDTVGLSVKAYFDGGSGYSSSLDSATMVGALIGAFTTSNTLTEGGVTTNQLETGIGSVISMFGVGGSSDDAVPGAYLNYMVFDLDMNYVGIAGFEQISSAANGAEELVEPDSVHIEQEGYLIAYLSNESNSTNYVHFDDFTVYHGKTNVVQSDDYYPFGLTFNSYTRSYSEPNNYKYNGKELQVDLGLELYDYGARLYDPAIGRFTAPDPLADLYSGISPYSYALNNPINNVDRMGLDVVNAHADDLDKAKKELEAAKKARGELGDDASKKDRKAADKKVNQAQGSVGKQQSLFDSAQAQIDDLKNNHSEFFEVLDKLTDAAGDKVDVSIGVQENLILTGKSGFTSGNILTTTDQNGQTVAVTKTLQDGTKIFTLVGGLSGKVNQIDIVIDSKYSTPGVASHEGGHAEHIAKFLTQYMNWIWDRMEEGKPMNGHDGHRFGDPSGKNADKRAEEYRQLNKGN